MALYQQERPKTLDDMIGMDSTVRTVREVLYKRNATDRPQCFLLTGPAGTGKTTLAYIMTGELGIDPSYITEINCANRNGIDVIREIESHMAQKPFHGSGKAYILDECHRLTTDAKEALLKPTENTPAGVYFFLCTTEPQGLKSTLVSRCMRLQTQALDDATISEIAMGVAEKYEIPMAKTVLAKLVSVANGNARQALMLLEAMRGAASTEEAMEALNGVSYDEEDVIALCRLLINGSSWKAVATELEKLRKADAESIRRVALGYATSVVLKSKGNPHPKAVAVLSAFEEPTYNIGFPGIVLSCLGVVTG